MNEKPQGIKKPTESEYNRAANAILRAYAPNIYPCAKCKWPVLEGYCCATCGDSNPRAKD